MAHTYNPSYLGAEILASLGKKVSETLSQRTSQTVAQSHDQSYAVGISRRIMVQGQLDKKCQTLSEK
jgi:hypothetical protein